MRGTDSDEKKKYVLQEIYETEKSFLIGLQLICEEFYQAVHGHLSHEDSELLFDIARVRPLSPSTLALVICHCSSLSGPAAGTPNPFGGV